MLLILFFFIKYNTPSDTDALLQQIHQCCFWSQKNFLFVSLLLNRWNRTKANLRQWLFAHYLTYSAECWELAGLLRVFNFPLFPQDKQSLAAQCFFVPSSNSFALLLCWELNYKDKSTLSWLQLCIQEVTALLLRSVWMGCWTGWMFPKGQGCFIEVEFRVWFWTGLKMNPPSLYSCLPLSVPGLCHTVLSHFSHFTALVVSSHQREPVCSSPSLNVLLLENLRFPETHTTHFLALLETGKQQPKGHSSTHTWGSKRPQGTQEGSAAAQSSPCAPCFPGSVLSPATCSIPEQTQALPKLWVSPSRDTQQHRVHPINIGIWLEARHWKCISFFSREKIKS